MNNALINKYNLDLVRDLMDVVVFSAVKHKFQKRKGALGIPYINHPLEVTNLILHHHPSPSVELLKASLLHDVLEDTDTTPEELKENFGVEVCHLVQEVSDDMSLSSAVRKNLQIEKAEYLTNDAKCIKIADKTCNIRDILHTRIQWPVRRKVAYIQWAIKVINKVRGDFPALEAEFDGAVKEASSLLKTDFSE